MIFNNMIEFYHVELPSPDANLTLPSLKAHVSIQACANVPLAWKESPAHRLAYLQPD
jgi:hypothetical protein